MPCLKFWLLVALVLVGGCLKGDARDFDDYLAEMEQRGLYTPPVQENELPEEIVPKLCSQAQAGASRTMVFVNATAVALSVGWVNSNCELLDYGTVAAGAEHTQQTFVGHAWRFAVVGTSRSIFEILVQDGLNSRVVIGTNP